MVAPLIVGAARVLGKKAVNRVPKTRLNKPNSLRKGVGGKHLQDTDVSGALKDGQNRISHRGGKLRGGGKLVNSLLPPEVSGSVKKLNTYSACITIFLTTIPFWFFQFILWVIGLFGFGADLVPLMNYVFDGRTIFVFILAIIGAVGLCLMTYGAVFLWIRKVDWYGEWKGFVFILCISLYFAPFINLFPWISLWLLTVVYQQKNEE